MKQNDAGARRGHDARVIALGFIAAALYWIIEAATHAYVLGIQSFVDAFLRPDANELWMRLTITGLIVGFGFYASSKVAALRRSEENARAERDKTQRYFDAAEVVFVVLGADGRIVEINRAGCDVLGCDRAGIIGADWFENFIPERLRKDVLSVFRELVSGDPKGVEYFENPVLTKGQGERIITWHNAVLTDEKGAIVGTLSAGMDITERKKMEDELRQNLDELERMNRLMVGRELKIVELKREMLSLMARNKELEAIAMNR